MHTVISARILDGTLSNIKRSEEDGTMDTVSSATAGVPFPKDFLFWPLCCLFFFDIRIMITPLVSSNSYYPAPL
jgi:hypothetical protein